MLDLFKYILANYTWLLIATILTLLAIIGYFAEKTNFGQGKQDDNLDKENKEDKTITQKIEDEENKQMLSSNIQQPNNLENNNVNNNSINNNVSTLNAQPTQPIANPNLSTLQNVEVKQNVENTNKVNGNNTLNTVVPNINTLDPNVNKEVNNSTVVVSENASSILNDKQFDKFEKEFDSVLPKKKVIDSDLLEDIDELSLDKTQKFKLTEIPDLDDVDLPKIKDLKSTDTDIWKF